MKQYLDSTGLSLVWAKVKNNVSTEIGKLSTVYAALSHKHTISDISDLSEATDSKGGLMTDGQASKLAGIAAGAQVNTVSGVQVDGADLTPDSNKKVNIDLSGKVDKEQGKGLSSNDYTSDEKSKLAGIAAGAQVNVLEGVKVNGTDVAASGKKVDITVPTKTSDLTNDDNTVKDANYVHTDTNFTATEKAKLSGVATGAQVNVLESVKVNGRAQTITEKGVDITVPTKTSDVVNDSDFQTGEQVQGKIDAAVAAAYKAKGSKTAAGLTDALLVKANLGNVYNISEAFTTTAKFVEGAGKKYPAGTNVAVVEGEGANAGSYFFDVQSGFINTDELETGSLTEAEINSICV